MYIFKVNK